MPNNYRFGQQISREEADEIFARFIRIREEAMPDLKKAFASKPELYRYYCGREDADPMLEDWAFVFDYPTMKRIMDILEADNSRCVFFFHGALGAPPPAQSQDLVDQQTPPPAESAGRPTLMMFAATYDADPAPGALQFKMFDKNGEQHAGTGGGTRSQLAKPVRLPEGFFKGQYTS